jgi:diacylglycerol kinase
MLSIKRFYRSFVYAFRGLRAVARHEQSFRLQLIAAVIVLIVIFVFDLANWERILFMLMVSAVLVLEVINSIFERISDAFKPRLSPIVKEVKDMMAGAVLITSFTSILVAVMILWSYFKEF